MTTVWLAVLDGITPPVFSSEEKARRYLSLLKDATFLHLEPVEVDELDVPEELKPE